MNTQDTIVYDCPCCGQGGLELARLKTAPASMVVVCAECDRIWLDTKRVGLHNDAELEDALNKIGVTGGWSELEIIQQGIPWASLDEQYQQILTHKHLK